MEILIDQSNTLFLDLEKWMISTDRHCELVEESSTHYTVQNKNGIRVDLPKHLFIANELSIQNGIVELSEGLYDTFVKESFHASANNAFNTLFQKSASLLFKHGNQVLTKPEYFLLKPDLLKSFDLYQGTFYTSLGALVQAWEQDTDLYFKSFANKDDLFLMAVSGSLLTNRYSSTFWCRSTGELLNYNSQNHPLPKGFKFYLDKFKVLNRADLSIKIDFQHEALQTLLESL